MWYNIESDRWDSMERKDFKEILPIHIDVCKDIVKQKGKCRGISCASCPFCAANTVKFDCEILQFIDNVEFAKQFIWLFENYVKSETTERIEDTQEFKDKHKHNATVEESNIKPNHYKLNIKSQDIEVMDIIDAVVKDMDGRKGYIVGNILKYVCRAEKKNGLEDYKKARTYLDMLIEGIK